MKKAWRCFIFRVISCMLIRWLCVQHPCYIFLSSYLAGAKAFFPIPWKENPELCYNWITLDLVITDRTWRGENWDLGCSLIPETVMWQEAWDFPIGLKTVGFHSWYWCWGLPILKALLFRIEGLRAEVGRAKWVCYSLFFPSVEVVSLFLPLSFLILLKPWDAVYPRIPN